MPLICPDTMSLLTPRLAVWCWQHGLTVQVVASSYLSQWLVIPGLIFGGKGNEHEYEADRAGRWNGYLRITKRGTVTRVLLDY